jgi:hypothetical protein
MKMRAASAVGMAGISLGLLGSCSSSSGSGTLQSGGAGGAGSGGRTGEGGALSGAGGVLSGAGGVSAGNGASGQSGAGMPNGGASDQAGEAGAAVSQAGAAGDNSESAGAAGTPSTCAGLACQITDCAARKLPLTSISGFVYAPNGTLPLFGVDVYVPGSTPAAFSSTVSCDRCADGLPGNPIIATQTDATGHFSLQGIPDGDDIPVIITIGKWRKQLKLPHIAACGDLVLDLADTTLPKSASETGGDITSVELPHIAISTGSADALECLVRKLGIADGEITTPSSNLGHVHLFADTQSGGEGVSKFVNLFPGGSGNFADSQTLWGNATDPGTLASYDLVLLSCEGAQYPNTKPQQAMDHLKAYADSGGRVLLSHWQNIWIEGSTQSAPLGAQPAVWPALATWSNGNADLPTGSLDTIDETDDSTGPSFATWMLSAKVAGGAVLDAIAISDNGSMSTGRTTVSGVDLTKVEESVYYRVSDTVTDPQIFRFTTPNEKAAATRCGEVVFSDLHLSADSASPKGGAYPTSCASGGLTPQEKALAFMFFDASSCVGPK